MLELLALGVRRWRPRIGWLGVTSLVLAVWAAAMGIMEAEWVDGDILFLYVSIVGALVAAVVAGTRIPGRWATLILGGTGLVYVSQIVARFLPPLVGAVQELWLGINWLGLRVAKVEVSPPAFPLWSESAARLITFGARLAAWGRALFIGESIRNPVAFLFVSGMILWACVAWAMWWILRRGRSLLGLMPLGAVLSMSTYLGSSPVGWMIAFVTCMTLLLPVVHISSQERRWDDEGIDYSTEIRFDVWQVTFLVTILVLLLSLVTPSFSIPRLVWSFWELVSRPQAVVEDLLTRFFGGVEPATPPELPVGSGPGARGRQIAAALPNSHLLGGDPDLSRKRVMYVCIDAPPPIPDEFVPVEIYVGPQYYWRGITYDTFEGWYWENKRSTTQEIPAYAPVMASTVTETKSLRQRYLIEVPHGETLYAVGEPDTVDQVVRSRTRAPDDLVGLQGTISDYVVRSEVSQATIDQLRDAPTDYPEHIVGRYLELYERTPARLRLLATEITQDVESPYDKAIAIERYLRQFEYDLAVPTPPPEQDVVAFFLFDVQRGYCDYYASAFVVLARAAGVPARLAVGFAMGEYDTERGCYAVLEKHAHAWPEVYFPGYGWIAFEPTAPFRLFERPADETSFPQRAPIVPAVPRRSWALALRSWWREARGQWTTYVAITAAALLVLSLIVQAFRQWRHSRLTSVEAIAECHRDMLRMGERLGVARHPSETPAEYSVRLSAAIRRRAVRWPWRGRRLPLVTREAAGRVQAVCRAYERASYAAHLLVKAHQIQAERQWGQLRRELRWLSIASVDVR
jgi:transglutaminase-like putative cysteine protease